MHSSSLILTLLPLLALHTATSLAIPIDNSGNAYSGNGGHASGGNVTTSNEKNGFAWLVPSLLNYKSYNAGSGGDSSSGDAIGMVPGVGSMLSPKFGPWSGGGTSNSGNAYTQDGGVADGGSVDGPNTGLINIDSYNAGDGGKARSGTAVGGAGYDGGIRKDNGNDDREGGKDNDHDDHEDGHRDNRNDGHHEHHRDEQDCDC